jgi:hypothetical protein
MFIHSIYILQCRENIFFSIYIVLHLQYATFTHSQQLIIGTLSSMLVTTRSSDKFLFSSFNLSTAVLNIITKRSNFAVRLLSVLG